MKVLLVDAYDSFTHIIDQYLRTLGAQTQVIRSRTRSPEAFLALSPDAVVLGPGPGHPADSGHVPLVLAFAAQGVPVLGVCLGHQAIGLAYGGCIGAAPTLMHGKTSVLHHDGSGVFAGTEPDLTVTRYHSLVVDHVPSTHLEVTARAREDGAVMGIRHRLLPVEGVQFHPESVATHGGIRLLRNFLTSALSTSAARSRMPDPVVP